MKPVHSNDIHDPKIKVAPPRFIIPVYIIIMAILVAAVIYLPIAGFMVKSIIVAVIALMLFGIIRNHRKGSYLTTMQANADGLYFQTDDYNQYYFVPWKHIGVMEKAVFPLNSRGLRIEVEDEAAEDMVSGQYVGNIRVENGRTFVYTLPQLQDRDKLIEKMRTLKMHSR